MSVAGSNVLTLFLLIFMPWIIQHGLKKYRWMDALGFAFWCYVTGVLIAMTPFYANSQEAVKSLMHAMIPLALPFFVFAKSATEKDDHTRKGIQAFSILIVVVILVSVVTGIVFKRWDNNAYYHAAMCSGTYIGGTINMASLAQIFNLPHEEFLMVNASDTVLGGIYLLLLLSFMPKIFGLLLKRSISDEIVHKVDAQVKYCTKDVVKLIAASILVAGISFAATLLFPKSWESVIFFVFITIFSLLVAKKIPAELSCQSSTVGNYFLMIFCVCVGTQLNLKLVLNLPWSVFGLVFTILSGSVILHWIVAKFFRIDRDIFIIANTAGIFGPAFIAPVSDTIKRNDLLVTGIALGVLGNILGNYAGILVQKLSAFLMP